MPPSIGAAFVSSDDKQQGGTGSLLLFIWLVMLLILWGFAFIPNGEAGAEWVRRTQYVCFGTQPNGLPAVSGWMLLILSPLALISAIWASHAQEIHAAPAFIKNNSTAKIFFALLVPIFFLEGHWVGTRLTVAYRDLSGLERVVKNPLPIDYLRLNTLAPKFSLVDQSGKTISQDIFLNKVTILTFAFAHCSTICSFLINDAVTAHKRLNHSKVQTVIVTLDPWRDTPSSLPSLAKNWSLPPDSSYLLSGHPDAVSEALKNYNIVSERDLRTGNVVHAAQIMMVDRQGRIVYSFLNPTVDWIVSAADRLLFE